MKRIPWIILVVIGVFAYSVSAGLLQERQAAVIKARSSGGATPTPTPTPTPCSGSYGNETGSSESVQATAFTYQLRKITIGCAGTTASIEALITDSENDTREVIFVLYNDSGGHPTTLIANGAAKYLYDNCGAASDTAINESLAAGTYWAGILKESSATGVCTSGSTSSGISYLYAETDFVPDADLSGVGTVTDYELAIWMEF